MLHAAETIDIQQKNSKEDYLFFIKSLKTYLPSIYKSKIRRNFIEDNLHNIGQVKKVDRLVQYSYFTFSSKKIKPKKTATVFLQYYLFIQHVNEKIKILYSIFRKQCYIHTDFHNWLSVKKHLFVFTPQFTYNSTGGDNQIIMTNEKMRKLNLNKLHQQYINYWMLDKLALVNVLSKIEKI